MKRALVTLAGVCLLAFTGIASFVIGARVGQNTAKEHLSQAYLDMAAASLISAQAPEASEQTKEYAKAQFYYYAHRTQRNIYQDLGPVDLNRIDGLEPFIRHADSPNDYYKKAEQDAAANP